MLSKKNIGLTFCSCRLPAALFALATLTAQADTPFTATGYVYQVPVPGISVTNPLGQVQLKANVHVMAMQASDPRLTGRLQAALDLAFQADGTALGGGPAYLEVGTWQNQTNFTPAGGLWVLNYRGVVQADNSNRMTITGYGVGGEIDGLRTEASTTRAAGSIFDPTIPYLVSGIIKPPPVTLTNSIPPTDWMIVGSPASQTVSSNQVTLRLSSPSISQYFDANLATDGPFSSWVVTPGQTLEARVRVVRLNEPSGSAGISLWHDWGQGYGLFQARDYVVLMKYNAGGLATFQCKKVTASNTNVVLVLALTPSGQDVDLTGRVLDGTSGGLLCELAAQDTPGADPSLTADQFQEMTGMQCLVIASDTAGQPWTSGIIPAVMLEPEYTSSALPAAEATFEGLELRTYDIPPVSISRAVQVTIPCPDGVSYSLETAPILNGPWLPVNVQTPPGIQRFTVPAVKGSEFFRPQLAP